MRSIITSRTVAPVISRRRFIAVSAATGGAVMSATPIGRAVAGLAPTPPQTLGPFYPSQKPLDSDSDLTIVDGQPGRAKGAMIHVQGRVIDGAERPVRGARVEIWQANHFGRYHHPRERAEGPFDPSFQGYGVSSVDPSGVYRFLTIRPPPYPASSTWMRPAHIHFRISGPGFEPLVTQMYFEGDPHLAADHIFNAIADPAARRSVVVPLRAATAGVIDPPVDVAVFDIVLPGRA